MDLCGAEGSHWPANTDTTMQFYRLMYRTAEGCRVDAEKVRCAISDCCIIEKIPEEVNALRALPLPPRLLRELWIRTQNERVWHLFWIFPETTAKIEFNAKDNYRNTHFRKEGLGKCLPPA